MSSYLDKHFSSLINSRIRLYWLLQTIGWVGYVFFVMAGAAFWEKSDLAHLSYTLVAAVMGLLFSMGMRHCFHIIWDEPATKRLLYTLLIVAVPTGLWALWKFYVAKQLYHDKVIENFIAEYIYWYSYSFFIFLSWTGLYYGIRFYQEIQAEREKNLRITSSAHQSQLKMLRYQLNPHFLFNTLNAISTLILENKGTVANDMVSALSRFLRYSLDNDPMVKVNLVQEVEAMQLYLSIEKIRFEERLQLEFNLEDEAKQALIPSMLLQPLIENSIKYAVAKSETGGTIKLEARVFAGNLLMELSDDGDGIEMKNNEMPLSNGVGLNNTRERLQQLYGDNHACEFGNIEPNGLKVSIRIPYEKEEA
ncbi:MAG: histidine kinase [Gammaproteobacteria bacterium]|nr:histidine kinase [Gammaproteobacteria bacterium]